MCSNFGSRKWQRCRGCTLFFRRKSPNVVIFVLVFPLMYGHILNQNIVDKDYLYQNFLNKNYENYSISQNKNDNEGNGFVRFFRFHDFEPRSLSVHTWPVLYKGHATELNDKSDRNLRKGVSDKRKVRGIHFEDDGKDLSINLEFIIPFLKVPVTRSIEITKSAFRKLADLNSSTLLLGGGFVIAAAVIAAVVKTVSASTFYGYNYQKATRAEDFMDNIDIVSYAHRMDENITTTKSVRKAEDVLSTLEQRLYLNNINVTACAQRAICSYLQRTTKVVQAGKESPAERIIHGIANLDLLRGYLNGTAVMNAIESGRKNNATSCDLIYRGCKWTNIQNKAMKITMEYFISNFLKFYGF